MDNKCAQSFIVHLTCSALGNPSACLEGACNLEREQISKHLQ